MRPGLNYLGLLALTLPPIPRLLCPSSGVQLGEAEKKRNSHAFGKFQSSRGGYPESLPLRAGGVGAWRQERRLGSPGRSVLAPSSCVG